MLKGPYISLIIASMASKSWAVNFTSENISWILNTSYNKLVPMIFLGGSVV